MGTNKTDSDNDKQAAVDSSGNVVAAVYGELVTSSLGLPGAGIASGFVAPLIHDYLRRKLSPRQSKRVGVALETALHDIQAATNNEMKSSSGNALMDRSVPDTEELLEQMLLSIKDESENRKAKHVGHITAYVCLSETLSARSGHHLIKTAESLSYQQFCYLSLVEEKGTVYAYYLRNGPNTDPDAEVLRQEEMELTSGDFGRFRMLSDPPGTKRDEGFGFVDSLNDFGRLFAHAARFYEIPKSERFHLEEVIARSQATGLA